MSAYFDLQSALDTLKTTYKYERDYEDGGYECVWNIELLNALIDKFSNYKQNSLQSLAAQAGSGELASARVLEKIGDFTVVPMLFSGLGKAKILETKYFSNAIWQILSRELNQNKEENLSTLYDNFSEAARSTNREISETASKWISKISEKMISNDPHNKIAHLIALLHDNPWQQRVYAVQELGDLGDNRAVAALIVKLSDNNHHVKLQAILALGKICDRRAVSPLVKLLDDETSKLLRNTKDSRNQAKIPVDTVSEKLHHAIYDALIKIGDNSIIDRLFSDLKKDHIPYASKELIAYNLPNLQGDIYDRAIQFLFDGDRVDTLVVRLLGRIGDTRSSPVLINIMNTENTDNILKRIVIETLGEIGGEQAVEALLPALYDTSEFVRAASACALSAFIDKNEVTEALKIALHDRSERVKRAAKEALKGINNCNKTINPGEPPF